jgi:Fe-S-cluster containining protein
VTDEVRRRLLEVYAEVDAAVRASGVRCDSSGRCCRFKEWGHVLYLSAIEAEFLLETAPAYATPVSSDGCPFQVENLCTARDERPLGCRIYFCDPAYQETGNALTEASLAKLKRLCDEEGLEWRYAPLHVFLNDAGPRGAVVESNRLSLPTIANGI